MFSKMEFKKIVLVIMAVTGTLAGCNVKVGETPPPPKAQEFSGTNCLSRVNPYLSDFIEGKTTPEQLNDTWTCFSTALDKFRKYVRGSSEDRYTSQELSTFLEDNFLDKRNAKHITPTLQIEFMKIKQMFIGGSREFLTMDDLDHAMGLIESFRRLTLDINPYMKVFALNWTPPPSDPVTSTNPGQKYFDDADAAIQDFATDLSSLIQKNHQGYDLADFVTFCREMSALSDKPWESLDKIVTYMPVVQKVKKTISGGSEATVAPQEWRSFLLLSARGYVQFLRYHYFVSAPTGEDRATRLNYMALTIQDCLSVFQELVKGKPSGVVTRDEVNELLNTLAHAWSEFKTSDKLVLEGMKIKRLLIGGSLDAFSIADFANAGSKVGSLKDLITQSLPYLKVYSSDWKPQSMSSQDAQQFFLQAQNNLSAVLGELGKLLEGEYDIESFSSFVDELVSLYPRINGDGDDSLDKLMDKFTPLVIAAKNMAFNDDSSVIKKAQWPGFLQAAAGGYSIYLYKDYFIGKKLDLESSQGLRRLENIVNQVIQLCRDMMKLNSGARFSLDRLNNLAKKADRADLLPEKLDAEIIRMAMSTVVNRILLDPELRQRGKYPSALNAGSLDVLQFEFKVWLEQELFFASLFKHSDDDYSMSSIQNVFSKKYAERGLSKELNTGLKEMIMALDSSGIPMTLTSKDYLIISGKVSQRYDRESLSQLNLNRLLARVLIRSYTNDLKRISSYKGFNLSEAQRAYRELRPIAVRMDLVESDNTDFADSRFREANIFVPSADGDDYASFRETTELVGMIWSGVRLNNSLERDLERNCLGGRHSKGSTQIDVNCAIQVFDKSMRVNLKASLPEHVKYMNAIGFDVWTSYITSVMKAAGYVPNSSGKATMRDLSLAPHVIQYLEMMFAKFDKNNDYFIDSQEALQAFPTFQPLIKKFADGEVADKDLDSVFTYILRYGKPPESIYEKLQFVTRWKGKPYNWDVHAERTLVSRILGYIADQMASPSKGTKTAGNSVQATARPAAQPQRRTGTPSHN